MSTRPFVHSAILLVGATADNLGGTLQLTGFSMGTPVFTVVQAAPSKAAKEKKP